MRRIWSGNWRITRRDELRKRLTVQLWYVPRRVLQPLLDRLGGFGLVPDELEMVEPSGRVLRLPLRELAGGRRRVWWAAVPAGVALLVLIATPFVRQSWAIDALEAEQARLQPLAARSEQLRDRFAAGATSAVVSAAETKRVGDVLQVLATVTDCLPDDTVLTEIAVRQRRLTITGTSEQAARLIADLSANTLLRNPVFTAPITRNAATGRDSFALRAEIAP